jgi:hypothetical protein
MDENNIILECDFEFKCPKKWENLAILDDPEKRFCTSCEREIFFVTTRQQLKVYKKLGRCIAANVYSPERSKMITIAGGVYPGNATIHVFGDQENTDEVMVAIDYVHRKKKRRVSKNKKEQEQL